MARNPRAEANERLGGQHDARVLEPSPPAVTEAPFFADDPVAGGDIVPVDREGATSWDAFCAGQADPDLDSFCAARWLGRWPRLVALPATFVATREALHAVAEHVLAPARHAANGKIGLRYTYDGFGTPFYRHDEQLRVEGTDLVAESANGTRRTPLTSLATAFAFSGVASGTTTGVFTPTTTRAADELFNLDPEAAHGLAEWVGFCFSVLEQLRTEMPEADRLQLWPEHFDAGLSGGNEASGAKANYGGSPGDEGHSLPYLYVGPWTPRSGGFWNEPFGASVGYGEIVAAADQRGAALDFFRRGRDLLAGGTT
ncbi:MAG: hypothetical protein QOK39_1456 [Acidimicrobiaceae bacterium]|nr:hypothetical protein [Acidimicrobiaceae bacterium]